MESVIALLDRLESLLAPGRGGGARRPEAAEALAVLRMIRAALPAELHHAQRLREEAETLHRRAADEARRMILDAEALARRQYEEGPHSELVLRRTHMVEEAQAEADQIRRGADEYAARVLAALQAHLERVLGAIQRGKTMLGSDGR